MPGRAIAYIAAVVSGGAAAAGLAVWRWQSQDPLLAVTLAVLAVWLSTMKIPLPRMTGTLAAGFVAVQVSIALLSWQETTLIAGLTGVVQCVWRARVRPSAAQMLFNGAALSLSGLAAYRVAHLAIWNTAEIPPCATLMAAAVTDYMVNSLLVAAVLCLLEEKPLWGIFRNSNFWALPYYAVGMLVAGPLVQLRPVPIWWLMVLAAPVLWMIWDWYRRFVAAVARTV